jgi:FtsP/CotA-like multicopper oxidase with cupredoxin domain
MKTRKYHFLKIGALLLTAALLAVVGFSSGAIAAPGAAPSEKIQGAPMAALPEATCTLVDTTRTCELWALEGNLTTPDPDGVSIPVWGFADSAAGAAQVPGPVIRANAGETLEIVLHNEVDGEIVALAFPGQELIPDLEGVPLGGTATYSFAVNQTGTFLYEAGLTERGARQVAMGLFGPLVVDPAPAADQELLLVFSELDPAFNADPLNFSMFHYQPKYWLINGQAWPDTGYIDVAADSTLLLRYLNAGVEHRTVGLLGLDQQVLAADGEALPFPRGAVAEPLAPGETKEALVDVLTAPDGTLYPLYNASLHQHNNNQRLTDTRAAFGGMLTFLRVAGEPPPTGAGPVASNVTVVPQKTNGTVDVTFSASLSDPDGVAAAEYFVDAVGAVGSGTPVTPDGTGYVEVIFTPTDLAAWTSGEHILYIRGQDALGNWGQVGSAVLYLDKTGPSISGMGLNPNPTNGSVDVALSATADDRATGNSNVIEARYSLDNGLSWVAMNLSATGTSVKALTATILAADVAALGEGVHPVVVQALDDLGNWTNPPASTNLTVDTTGPEVPAVSLNPTVLDFTQPNVPVSIRLTATVQDVMSTLVNAEGFIKTVGTPGTGFALYPSDGLFDEPVEDVYYDIPSSAFASYLSGDYQVFVSGKDKAGNWSPVPGSATITIVSDVLDTAGPYVSNLALSPNPTGGATSVTLTALATDVNLMSNVVGAEYWIGTKKNAAHVAMSATDGAFDSANEWVQATIEIARNMKAGTYLISVRARDAAGNWGPVQTIDLIVE